MERARFQEVSTEALERIDAGLGALEHDDLDIQLSGDVLTLAFADGTRYVINAHSAAGQVWMAAERNAWHFDFDEAGGHWIAHKTGDELMATVARVVGDKLHISILL